MLVQSGPKNLKNPEQIKQVKTPCPNQGKASYHSSAFWEMSAQDALKVNYLIYEHQSIQS